MYQKPPKTQLTMIPMIPFLADDNAVRVPVGDVASGDEPAPRGPPAEQRTERGGIKHKKNRAYLGRGLAQHVKEEAARCPSTLGCSKTTS